MLNDSCERGTKYVAQNGKTAKVNSTKESKRLTVLGLTTLNGQPLMCVVIFFGKDRNLFVESGVDPFHSLLYNKHNTDYTNSNFNFFQDNYGPDKLFPGSPVCNFEGKNVPTIIRYSEKGSILMILS